jgi:hypothetical protein
MTAATLSGSTAACVTGQTSSSRCQTATLAIAKGAEFDGFFAPVGSQSVARVD